jgi:phosphate transport system substrate-binding protein
MSNPTKLLAIDGIAPSDENIRNGTYPFTVNVYAVTAGTSNQHVQDLIDWMLSPQGQELVEKTGYVGVRGRD